MESSKSIKKINPKKLPTKIFKRQQPKKKKPEEKPSKKKNQKILAQKCKNKKYSSGRKTLFSKKYAAGNFIFLLRLFFTSQNKNSKK
jgi:hypothetical protein